MSGHQAQHTQHVQHAQQRSHSERRDSRGRREPRSFDRDTHHRIEERRYRHDRDEIRFEGYWFTCGFWPEWVYTEDVYFVMGPNNVWFLYQYGNPAYMVQVTLVD